MSKQQHLGITFKSRAITCAIKRKTANAGNADEKKKQCGNLVIAKREATGACLIILFLHRYFAFAFSINVGLLPMLLLHHSKSVCPLYRDFRVIYVLTSLNSYLISISDEANDASAPSTDFIAARRAAQSDEKCFFNGAKMCNKNEKFAFTKESFERLFEGIPECIIDNNKLHQMQLTFPRSLDTLAGTKKKVRDEIAAIVLRLAIIHFRS